MKHSFSIYDKEINVILGDITEIETDCIVSSDDNNISMSGGVSEAIHSAAGDIIWEESRKYVPAQIRNVYETSAGNLKCKYILHAIVIDFDNWQYPDIEIIKAVTITALKKANELNCNSISLPAFGTGAGSLNSSISANAVIDIIFKILPELNSLRKVNIILFRADTLFDFFSLAIINRSKLEYEPIIEKLEKEKEKLLHELKNETKYKHIPFPIAYLKRFTDNNIIFHSKFTSHLECIEGLVKFLSIIVISYLYNTQNDNNIKSEIKNFFAKSSPPGFGSWNILLNKLLDDYKIILKSNKITLKIYDFYKSKNKRIIEKTVAIRNSEHAHGSTLHEDLYKDLLEKELEPNLKIIFNSLTFFEKIQLIVIQDINFDEDDSDFYIYKYSKLMGESAIFETDILKSNLRLSRNKLYIIHRDLNCIIKTEPFMVYENCDFCKSVEPYYLERITENNCHYHKYKGNHKREIEKYINDFNFDE